MSNHVHFVIKPLRDSQGDYYRISKIVQELKSFTAQKINQQQLKKGQVRDRYYFDRIIRDSDDYYNVIRYVLNNPVKAGLVNEQSEWRDSYYRSLEVDLRIE